MRKLQFDVLMLETPLMNQCQPRQWRSSVTIHLAQERRQLASVDSGEILRLHRFENIAGFEHCRGVLLAESMSNSEPEDMARRLMGTTGYVGSSASFDRQDHLYDLGSLNLIDG